MKTLLFVLSITGSLHAKYLLLGPMVCHVDETSARVWCSLDEKGTVVLKLSENADLKNSRTVKAENFEMGTIELDNLKPDTVYYYQLIGNTYSKSPHCNFRTAKATDRPVKLRFVFSSCSGDRHFTAGYQIRGKTIEVTSGPLGSNSSKRRICFSAKVPGKCSAFLKSIQPLQSPR